MSGRGKGGNVKGKSKSRSTRAGLQFPVGRTKPEPHRFRPGTVALHAIRPYCADLILSSSLMRLALEIAEELGGICCLASVVMAMMEASGGDLLEDHAAGNMPKDIQLARRIRGEHA